jgi:hypothetical protein
MKFLVWALGLTLLTLAASCNLLDPGANQVTVEASNQSGSSCPVTVNLDGNNTVLVSTGTFYTFPVVSSGSHTLNFSTSGSGCVYNNNNNQNYADTFNTSGGNVYVGTVKPVTVNNNVQLSVSGP